MGWQEAARLLLPIAEALDYAHSQNVIHRDVKPSNILLTGRGQPMLSDFGIAKILEEEQTQGLTASGTGVGTPEYMAPEQWTGKTCPQSDLYSLGVVFYELLTGRKPYTADTPAALMLKQLNDPLPSPRQFVPDLPEGVEKVLLRALAKKPDDRYTGMQEFSLALEAQLSAQAGGKPASPVWWKRKEPGTSLAKEPVAPATEPVKPVDEKATRPAPKPAPEAPIEPVSPPDAGEQTLPATPRTPPALPPKNGKPKLPPAWIIALLGVVVLAYLVIIALLVMRSSGLLGPLKPYVSPVPTQVPLPTETPAPTLDDSTWTRPADGMLMVYVPEGEFSMGGTADQALAECQKFGNDCKRDWFIDEEPPHMVSLDAFWIDQTEVTNAMYEKCVIAGDCQPPSSSGSSTRSSYYGDSKYADYPVIYVDWNMTQTYCQWTGARLPTEAEWEKAARGTDERIYPWGNESPTCSLANFGGTSGCKGDTDKVGSYPSGASLYGALDMAGNVWEWVNDWYGETYYKGSPQGNPQGPSSGSGRVLRGGSWYFVEDFLRSALRSRVDPSYTNNYFGFRCSRSLP